jgi:hypothetical protein
MMIKKILAAAAFGTVALGAQASTNLLTDGNFESTGLSFASSSYCYAGNVAAPQCNAPSYAVNGWTGTTPVFLQSGSGPWGTPSDQAHTGIDLGGVVAAVQGTSALSSTFSFIAGDVYTLSWADAGRTNYGYTQTYSVTAGDQLIGDFTTNAGHWNTHSFTFTATGADALVFQGLVASDSTSFIDNVSVTAVPEPTALLMMAVGTLGLLAWRRRAQA